jgi:tricarballylate dehydrogenase
VSIPTDPDVLVIGGGNAGLCAAIAARRAGARVVLVERATRAWRGGNSKYTRNLRCVNDGTSAFQPGRYDHAAFAADLARVSGTPPSPELAELAIAGSRDAPGWMERYGARWQSAMRSTLHLSATNRFFLGGGKALLNTYYATCERLGVSIAYETTVDGLEHSDDRVVAVTAALAGGDRMRLRPRAVVAAAGGFEANLERLARAWGPAAANFAVRGSRGNDGAVLEYLVELGASTVGSPRDFHAVAVDARGPRFEGGIVTRIDSVPFGIVVNRDGVRFADEGADLWPLRYARWGTLIAEQPDQVAHAIFDDAVIDRFVPSAYRPIEADTIGGLADRIVVPPERLAGTIQEFNAACGGGAPDYERLDGCRTVGVEPPKSNWARPIERPPFRAYPLRPGVTFTYLGVVVDASARVLAAGAPFANLYAAGELMAGNILAHGYLAGFGMTIGTVFGIRAGTAAAAHAA